MGGEKKENQAKGKANLALGKVDHEEDHTENPGSDSNKDLKGRFRDWVATKERKREREV